MIPDYQVKQGSTIPPLKVNLTGRDGKPADLTGATVKFIMKTFSGVLKFDGTCEITNIRNAEVQYQWQTEDVEDADQFEAQFIIDKGNGELSIFPSHRNLIIEIVRGLDTV